MASARTIAVRAALVTAGILAVGFATLSGETPAVPIGRPDGTPELPGIDLAERAPAPAPTGATPPAVSPTSSFVQGSFAPPTSAPAAAARDPVPDAPAPPPPAAAESAEPPPAPDPPAPPDAPSDTRDEEEEADGGLHIRIAGVDADIESDLFDALFG